MKVWLLLLDGRHHVFYAEGGGEGAGVGSEGLVGGRGPLGWLEGRWREWQGKLARAETGAGRVMRAIEGFLKRFVAPDEGMLRGLRGVEVVELIHPAGMEGARVRRWWRRYLARQEWRHGVWLVVNGLLLPPAVVLSLLPGPNVLGFWYATRVAGHGLAVLGVRRARGKRVELRLRGCERLDVELLDAECGAEAVRVLSEDCGLVGLRGFLEESRPGGPHGTAGGNREADEGGE